MRLGPRVRNDAELVSTMLPETGQGMGKAPKLHHLLVHIRLALPPLISASQMRDLTPVIYTLPEGLDMNLVPLGAITTKPAIVARLPTFNHHMTQLVIMVAGILTINPRTAQRHLVEVIQTLIHHYRAWVIVM